MPRQARGNPDADAPAEEQAQVVTATTDNENGQEVPFKVGGVTRKKLTVRRPKVRDRLAAEGDGTLTPAHVEVRLLGMVSGLSPDEISLMDMADYFRLQKQMRDFTGSVV